MFSVPITLIGLGVRLGHFCPPSVKRVGQIHRVTWVKRSRHLERRYKINQF